MIVRAGTYRESLRTEVDVRLAAEGAVTVETLRGPALRVAGGSASVRGVALVGVPADRGPLLPSAISG